MAATLSRPQCLKERQFFVKITSDRLYKDRVQSSTKGCFLVQSEILFLYVKQNIRNTTERCDDVPVSHRQYHEYNHDDVIKWKHFP